MKRGRRRSVEQDERAEGGRNQESCTRWSARRTGRSVFELLNGTDDVARERVVRVVVVDHVQGRF
jgi:hypothetical protein